MRWKKLTVCNLGPFREEVTLDIDRIPGPIIAVTGENGAGKSTVLELLMAAITRECDTRGRIVDLATSRKAYFETELEYRGTHIIRHMVDGVARESEALVLDGNREPELQKTTKVSKFKKWAKDNLPDAQVLYNGQFAAQGKKGILGLKPGPRKSVILEALGCSELEEMAARAAQKGRESAKDCEGIEGRIRDERERGGHVANLAESLTQSENAVLDAESALGDITAKLENSRAELEKSKKKATEYSARREISIRLKTVSAERDSLIERLENNRDVLARRADVDAAVERATELAAAATAAGAAAARVQEQISTKSTAGEGYAKGLQVAVSSAETAEKRIREAESILEKEAACRQAAGELTALTEASKAVEGQIRAAEAEYETQAGIQLAGLDGRIREMRRGLQRIANGILKPVVRATLTLGKDDRKAAKIQDAPQIAAELKKKIAALADDWRRAQASQAKAERQAALLESMDAARARLGGAETDFKAAEAAKEHNSESAERLGLEIAGLQGALGAAKLRKSELEAERLENEKIAKQKVHLDQADARITELEPQIAAANRQIDALRTEIAAIPEHQPDECMVAVNQAAVEKAERGAETARSELQDRQTAVALAKEALDRAEQSAERRRALECSLAGAEQRQSDWERLARDLGKNGLQAYEIDCAGPEMTEITNDLLHNCYGPRFTVTVETTKMDAKGQRELEGCEIQVIDSLEGRDAAGETFSGGEQVIIDLPLRLAVASLSNDRAHSDCRPTLVFDESAAAVSEKNAPAYIAMLRRAIDLMNIDKVLIVVHAPWLERLADSVVRVRNRKIEVI